MLDIMLHIVGWQENKTNTLYSSTYEKLLPTPNTINIVRFFVIWPFCVTDAVFVTQV